jgi:hypothetical protein
MRYKLTLLMAVWTAAMTLCTKAKAQEDSIRANRYVMRSTMIGAGHNNVFETYLSPLEYSGPEVRFMHESMRMTRLLQGNVSVQNIIQVQGAYTENISGTANTYAGMINWNCALHYQFREVAPGLKLLAGPYIGLNTGVVYNSRNSNNPAQAKAYGGVGFSGAAIYKVRIKQYPLTIRYQANVPLAGAMFSPQYGESYYEMFSVGNHKGNVKFTSLHNNPSLFQMLTVDFPIRKVIMRAGYVCDIQQSKVNGLKSHSYSHDFMIGFVRNIYLLRGKNRISMSEKTTPF